MSAPAQKTADWPLQQAIYARLDGAVTHSGAVVPVYDYLPIDADGAPKTEYPFIFIGPGFSDDHSTHTTRGQVILQRITVDSVYQGWREAKEIKSKVIELLDSHIFDLSADGFTCYHAKYNDETPQRIVQADKGRVISRFIIEIEYRITVR